MKQTIYIAQRRRPLNGWLIPLAYALGLFVVFAIVGTMDRNDEQQTERFYHGKAD